MKDLKGKVAVITGGAGGIGRAVGIRFAQLGAKVALWDRDADALERAKEEFESLHLTVKTYAFDVSDAAAVRENAGKVRADLGEVDILDNNVGIVFKGDFLEMSEEKLNKSVDVNFKAYMWCTRAFLPGMIERGSGYIVFTASAAGLMGAPGMAVYCATKHAVVGFAESVRLELRKAGVSGVGMTIVCPSFINSGMFDGVKPPFLTRWLTVDEISDKIVGAVRKGRLYVREPWLVKCIPLLKMLGTGVTDLAGDWTGMHGAMEGFKKK